MRTISRGTATVYTDGARIHEFLHELNRETFGPHEDIITVGEMASSDLPNSIRYSRREEQELSMIFDFHHLKIDYPSGNKWEVQLPVSRSEEESV